jgi:hypothetical protein
MAAVRIFHDQEGQTLTVWFDEPIREYVCEQAADDVVLMKDRAGRVIGVEKLNFLVPESDSLTVVSEPRPLEKNLKLCARKGPSATETAQASVQIP